jgi:hypothetical protein
MKILLCMIVKNEASVIKRCLGSVYKYIDAFLICDTGSTDGTQEVIQNFFDQHNICGEVKSHEWHDFGTNRTMAIDECRGRADWILCIDADDWIEGDFDLSSLDDNMDAYTVDIGGDNFNNRRAQIFNLRKKHWVYRNPIHEYPTCEENPKIGHLAGSYIWHPGTDGGRSKAFGSTREKYFKDYLTIKNFMKRAGEDPRMQFYAAQSAFDAQIYDLAEKEYLERTNMGGWNQEVFYSWYRAAKCRMIKGIDQGDVIKCLMNAHEADRDRCEPLYEISTVLRTSGKKASAFIFAQAAASKELNLSKLFVHKDAYLWRALDEVGSTAYYANDIKVGKYACEKLLAEGYLPAHHRDRVQQNLRFYTC